MSGRAKPKGKDPLKTHSPFPGRPSVSATSGFSILEIIISLAIGLVLLSITAKAMSPAREATAVRSADQAVRSLVSRARAESIQRGTDVEFRVDPTGDSAWIQVGGQQITRFDFHDELGIDVLSTHAVTVCMTPRGVADANCNTPSVPTIGFHSGSKTRYVKILPSGQVVTS